MYNYLSTYTYLSILYVYLSLSRGRATRSEDAAASHHSLLDCKAQCSVYNAVVRRLAAGGGAGHRRAAEQPGSRAEEPGSQAATRRVEGIQ